MDPKQMTQREKRRNGAALAWGRRVSVCVVALGLTGCVTVAEFRKLERRVVALQRAPSDGGTREGLANLTAELEALQLELQRLQGRLDVTEKRANDALQEVKKVRRSQASAAAEPPVETAARAPEKADERPVQSASADVVAYRDAHNAWRQGQHDVCIDRFRTFLQTHPSSAYADDAAYWMADCHFKQGDFKNAVLRFDDVVRNYPEGNKAADALYRQGESLLRLGPAFNKAAKRAFERVVKEYPESARSEQAAQRIRALAAG
ncbi:MAG: tol-pal system protein YbgF [Proteobacteria bacterium]|nr:tol-pal system protein YbgF [Pseudomonadota bacterium]